LPFTSIKEVTSSNLEINLKINYRKKENVSIWSDKFSLLNSTEMFPGNAPSQHD
jgi:hypothetical protein